MINLNKQYVTKELLLRYLNEYDIFSHYLEEPIELGKNVKSPFYKDNTPSLGFFMGEGNEICFNDFKLDIKGDCVKFVQMRYNLTYFEALSKIAIDFNMDDQFIVKRKGIEKSKTVPQNFNIIKNDNYKLKLGKISKNWSFNEINFWKQYGISLKTLNKYNVQPISHVVYGEKIITCKSLAFAFIEQKDGIETYKIYQPFDENYKWLNSHDESVWQGWEQLPEKGKTLIVTKSLKDVMAINEVTGYDAVSLQSENVLPKLKIVQELNKRFDEIIIIYDNDYDKEENWGKIFSNRLHEHTGFAERYIPDRFKCKDFSDLVKNVGSQKASIIFNDDILMPF